MISIFQDIAETDCGLFGCRLKWLNRFATLPWFLALFLYASAMLNMPALVLISLQVGVVKYFGISYYQYNLSAAFDNIGNLSLLFFTPFIAIIQRRPLVMGGAIGLAMAAYLTAGTVHFMTDENSYQLNTDGTGESNSSDTTCGTGKTEVSMLLLIVMKILSCTYRGMHK